MGDVIVRVRISMTSSDGAGVLVVGVKDKVGVEGLGGIVVIDGLAGLPKAAIGGLAGFPKRDAKGFGMGSRALTGAVGLEATEGGIGRGSACERVESADVGHEEYRRGWERGGSEENV
jgi:hypothetical protein